jgi:hypothetical protein
MREITPTLTPELERLVGRRSVAQSPAYPVQTFRDLMQHAARLSYLNKDHLIFYRGQNADYQNRKQASSFYPSIYRGDYLRRDVVLQRFGELERAGRRLHKLFENAKIEGYADIRRRQVIQWAVLQHYDVCGTPLLDFTQSLRVACSFAQRSTNAFVCYVFLFGFPHITNRISVNSEHDLVTVRLLSICPPAALRPYFQEGYLAATADIMTEYNPKSELDFNRRLIAKFQIPTDVSFWGAGLSRMPDSELYPEDDSVHALCETIDLTASPQPGATSLGAFLASWTAVEQLVLAVAQRSEERVLSLKQAIQSLEDSGGLEPWLRNELQRIHFIRNAVVHGRESIPDWRLRDATRSLERIRDALEKFRTNLRKRSAT